METSDSNAFWQFDSTYWFGKLNSQNSGLSLEVIAERQSQIHQRKITSPFIKGLLLFLGQFKSPLMLMLLGAVLLSAFLGDTSDVFIILFIVISTGLISFFQERNAGKVVEKLQSMIALKCTVLRNGKEEQIISSHILPGDILLIKAGDILPADCLIIEGNEVQANESSLTGESFPVRKLPGALPVETPLAKRSNSLWEGSSIVSGNAKALVINTGADSLFGSITKSAETTIETSFEKGIRDFGYFLMKITLALSVFILTVNLLNHKSVIDSALFALALAVGMAPELLPAITTIAMSAGSKRMLAKKVIVKKLTSIQNLGEVNLLCTDKTGTITEGIIKVFGLHDGEGKESEFLKELAYWNSSLESGYSNPIDDALKELHIENTVQIKKLGEVPYDFIRKRLSIALQKEQDKLLISKGSYQTILPICNQARMSDGSIVAIDVLKNSLDSQFIDYGNKGLRAIGICYHTRPRRFKIG